MEQLIAGNTYLLSVVSGYEDVDGFSGRCSFVNATNSYSYDTTNYSGGSFHFNIPANITSGYSDGSYTKLVFAVSDTDRHTLATSQITILPDPLTTPTDYRSNARKIFEAIDAELCGNASPSQQSISIAGKAISRYSIPDLLKLRSAYESLAKIEEQEEQLGSSVGGKMKVRFL